MKKFRLVNNKFRQSFKCFEFHILFFNIIKKNNTRIPFIFEKKSIKGLRVKLRLIRIRAVCVMTGRTRGVYRYLRVSRMVLKGMGVVGYLPGIQRLSW
jgi:ribosomal protein S14